MFQVFCHRIKWWKLEISHIFLEIFRRFPHDSLGSQTNFFGKVRVMVKGAPQGYYKAGLGDYNVKSGARNKFFENLN